MRITICFALLFACGCGCRLRPRVQAPAPMHGDSPEVVRVTTTERSAQPETLARVAREEVSPVETVPVVRPKSEEVRLAEVNAALEDAYFAYDRSDLTPEALASLRRDAELLCGILAEFPGLKIIVEGHCDERGSAEYNLALGERRARRTEEVLREYRVPAEAIQVVSYGKEAPQCTDPSESCWQKNRRAHMAVKK